MQRNRYKDWLEAPKLFRDSPSSCGPISVWMILDHLNCKIDGDEIVELLSWSEAEGNCAIAIATMFKGLGFDATFYTDFDPDVQDIEKPFYELAKHLDLPIKSPPPIEEFEVRLMNGSHLIALYREDLNDPDYGHFSPISGVENEILQLANSNIGDLEFENFESRWHCPDYPRQLIEVRC